MVFFLILLSLLASAIVSFVFLPKTLRFFAELVGRNLRQSSNTRRELLLARVASETRTYEAGHERQRRAEDEWEEIDVTATGSADNGGQAESGWDGIIGFFHPFW